MQEWGPTPDRGWTFVSWSLSMEWLAYLLFPLLALLLWVLYERASATLLAGLWALALTPLMIYGLSTTDSYYTEHWGSTVRILTEFTAGAITYLVVRRLLAGDSLDATASPRVEWIASILAVVLPLLVIAGAIFLGQWPGAQPSQGEVNGGGEAFPPYYHLLLVPLLIAWIGALALSRRGVARFLSTRTLVLGGFISYSLYMTHLACFGVWRAGMNAIHVTGGPVHGLGVLVLVAGALVIAWLMWTYVEETARERMRGMVGVRRRPTEEAGKAIDTTGADANSASPISVSRTQTDPSSDRTEHDTCT